MVARIALVSNFTSDTEPTTTGAYDIQSGWQILNIKTSEAVGQTDSM